MRNSTQHREDGLRRRAFEVLVNELVPSEFTYRKFELKTGQNFDEFIWNKFERKCFNCQTDLPTPKNMHLDHTMPLAFLWELNETATCLCPTCNGSKLHKFPVDFYDEDKLVTLSAKTSLEMTVLKSKRINSDVLDQLLLKIEWFFDEFLDRPDYQKVRDGKRASDLIVHALHNSIKTHNSYNSNKYPEDLVAIYVQKTGRIPITVSTIQPKLF